MYVSETQNDEFLLKFHTPNRAHRQGSDVVPGLVGNVGDKRGNI